MKISSFNIVNNAYSSYVPLVKKQASKSTDTILTHNSCYDEYFKTFCNIYFTSSKCLEDNSLRFSPLTKVKPINTPCLDYSNIGAFADGFVAKLETQLMNPKLEEIKSLVASIKRETHAQEDFIREVLFRLTQFSSYDSIRLIEDELNKKKCSLVNNFKNLSINEVLSYLGNRKFYFYSEQNKSKAIFLDDMLLNVFEKRNKSDSDFYDYNLASDLIFDGSSIYLLDGFDVKASDKKYYSASFLAGCGYLKSLAVDVIKQVQAGKTLDEALNGDLIKRITKIFPETKGKINILKAQMPEYITDEDILNNIRTRNINADNVKDVIKREIKKCKYKNTSVDYKKALMKYFDYYCRIFSPQSLGVEVKKMGKKINAMRNKTNREYVFYVPFSQKSNSLITYMYKKNNPNDTSEVKSFFEKVMPDRDIVILDDISISGASFTMFSNSFIKKMGLENFTNTHFCFFPIVLSPHDDDLFHNCSVSFLEKTLPSDNVFSKKNQNKKFINEFFKSFGEKEVLLLADYLDKGFDEGINGVVFPYVIPDNSSKVIGELFNKFLYRSTKGSNKTKESGFGWNI